MSLDLYMKVKYLETRTLVAITTQEIIQSNKGFYTGVKPLERIMPRSVFESDVETGKSYVL